MNKKRNGRITVIVSLIPLFTKKKSHIVIALSLLLLFAIGMLHPVSAYADTEEKHVYLEFTIGVDCTVTNAEGETLVYKKGVLSGDMNIVSETTYVEIPLQRVEVKRSNSFTYRPETHKGIDFRVQGIGIAGYIHGENIDSITISTDNGVCSIAADGKDMEYIISLLGLNNGDTAIVLQGGGNGSSHVKIADSKDGAVIDGAEGVCFLTINNLNGREEELEFFPTSNPVVVRNIMNEGTPLTVSGAVVLSKKSYDVVSNLRLRNTDDETSLLLTFNKVKKADGYDVYRYNEKSKKYVKVKTLKGNWNVAWLDKGLVSGNQYKYKVQPWQTVSKKKKTMKMSYGVWGVTASETKANVTKIVVDKAKITGKKGQMAKLTATVTTVEGKEVLSGNIRWHSSDKTIAAMDKNGKVKLLKKGTCTIWAKAHDGLNSKRVTVRVK